MLKKVKLLYELEQGEAEVIVLAMERGIKQVLIDSIVEGGYWIKEDLVEAILKEAGE